MQSGLDSRFKFTFISYEYIRVEIFIYIYILLYSTWLYIFVHTGIFRSLGPLRLFLPLRPFPSSLPVAHVFSSLGE